MTKYKGFASNDGTTWIDLGLVEASTPATALRRLREEDHGGAHKFYGLCTDRSWVAGEAPDPPAERPRGVPTGWKAITPEQMTVDEVLAEAGLEEETKPTSPSQAAAAGRGPV